MTNKLSLRQRQLLESLEKPGAYISHMSNGWWEYAFLYNDNGAHEKVNLGTLNAIWRRKFTWEKYVQPETEYRISPAGRAALAEARAKDTK